MTVLIFTKSDVPVAGVVAALARRGVESVVVDTDAVPARLALSLADDGRVTISEDGSADVVIDDLQAVWYRRLAVRPDLPPGAPADLHRAVAHELRAFLLGILAAVPVPVLVPKWVIDQADRRPRQLSLAAAAGLDVPRSLTTTSLAAARDFVAGLGGQAITKMVTGAVLPEPGAPPRVMMTTPVDTATLAAMSPDELRLCPATFQERLDKKAEHRVTIVGDQLFVACLPAAGLPAAAAVDWRRDGRGAFAHWRESTLPPAVAAGLLRLMDRLGLDYGAADVIETTDGRHVFLELNPAGEYLWLEHFFGDAVREAIADLLSGATPRRLPPGEG